MLKTFQKGGTHLPENKLSAKSAIQQLVPPTYVTIPLKQHIGMPAVAVVKKGDTVKVGQLLAKSTGFVSANIHSSVSGIVLKVEEAPDGSGYTTQRIVIEVKGDEWEKGIDLSKTLIKNCCLDAKAIVDKIHALGIVGLGGATFPTHVKMTVPSGMQAEMLIINGAECEPYLTADHRLMLEKGEEILVGATILMSVLQVKKAVIGIESNKKDAIAHLQRLCITYQGIEVVPLKVKYPQGGEKQMIKAITGREAPSGALPIAVGVVVSNVGTAFAVYEAVQKNKPLVERIVTVTGDFLSSPANFSVRIGAPVKQLIEAVGGMPKDTGKIIMGGPMMGKAIVSTATPVVKGTSGIVCINEKKAKRDTMQHCIRCSRCVAVCPIGLEPYLLMSLSERQLWERSRKIQIMDCIECGSCSFTCPSKRPLLDYIRLGKHKSVPTS
jgi:electron transport complex protein RnfC